MEEPRVLAHERDQAPQLVEAELAQVAAADRDPAAIGSSKRSSSRAIVDLPEPLGPTIADALARAELEAELDVRRAARPPDRRT